MSLEAYAQHISDFVREHEAWAPPIVFALAFGESLAFISLLVPAWAALVAIGALVGVSGIEFCRSGLPPRLVQLWATGCLTGLG